MADDKLKGPKAKAKAKAKAKPKAQAKKPKLTAEEKRERTDDAIKHQIDLRGQYTRIAKRATSHLVLLKEATGDELKKAQKDKQWRTARKMRGTLSNIDALIADQYEAMGLELRENLVEVYEYEKDYFEKLNHTSGDIEDIDINTVFAVVDKDPFDNKVLGEWLTEQELSLQNGVKKTVRLGIINGKSDEEIAGELLDYHGSPFEDAEHNAMTLARTASAHVAAQAELAAFERDGVERYQISSVLDTRTTLICANLDGRVYSMKSTYKRVPPFHPNCRSTIIAVYDDDELALEEDFPTWLARQSRDDKIAILGAERYRLYEGGLPINHFVDLNNLEVIELDELKKRDAVKRVERRIEKANKKNNGNKDFRSKDPVRVDQTERNKHLAKFEVDAV